MALKTHKCSSITVICVLTVLCFTWHVTSSHGGLEEADAKTNTSNKRADALKSFLSGLDRGKVLELLKELPLELQQFVGQAVLTKNLDVTDGRYAQLQSAILKAARGNGILSAWKEKLDSLIFDDDASQKSESSVEKSVQETLGTEEDEADNEINPTVDQVTAKSVDEIPAPKKDGKIPTPPASAYDRSSQRTKGETNRMPSKKNKEPLDALVGMAKKYLGQDENDPTLDIVANMASAYLKTSQGSSSGGNNEGPDLSSLIQMASLFSGSGGGKTGSQGGNPLESIVSLLGNSGMDLNQMLQLGSAMMGQGADSRSAVGKKKTSSTSPIVELIIRGIAGALNMDPDYLLNYYNGLNKLMEANSWDEINSILHYTTGTDAEVLLDSLANNQVRQEMSDATTGLIVDWLQSFLDPESLKTRVFYVNAMLLQYNYPAIDIKNFIETFSQVVERLSKDFGDSQVDLRPYLLAADHQLKQTLKLAPSDTIDFRNINAEELTHALGHSMKSEIFDPLADLWSDFRVASRYPKCARTIVCLRNSAGVTTGLKLGITRATSTIVVWALSKTNNKGMPPFPALYAAAMDGANGVNCEARFQEPNCIKLLSEPLPMRLDYAHHEL